MRLRDDDSDDDFDDSDFNDDHRDHILLYDNTHAVPSFPSAAAPIAATTTSIAATTPSTEDNR